MCNILCHREIQDGLRFLDAPEFLLHQANQITPSHPERKTDKLKIVTKCYESMSFCVKQSNALDYRLDYLTLAPESQSQSADFMQM